MSDKLYKQEKYPLFYWFPEVFKVKIERNPSRAYIVLSRRGTPVRDGKGLGIFWCYLYVRKKVGASLFAVAPPKQDVELIDSWKRL